MSTKRRLISLFSVCLAASFLLTTGDASARRRTNNANKPAATASFGSFSNASSDDKGVAANSPEAQKIADEEAAVEAAEKKAKTSIGQPLSQRIKAVTAQSYLHQGKFLIGPKLGTTINDPFYSSLALGLNAGYYVTEHLLIGLSGEFLPANIPTSIVKVVGRDSENKAKYYAPMYFAYIDVNWVPFYGKLSLMAESVLHYDFYLVGGLGIAGMRSKDENVENPPLSFSGEIGIGVHLFIKQWVALRIELTDRISYGSRYIAVIPGTEETSMQNIIGLTVGADFFLRAGKK